MFGSDILAGDGKLANLFLRCTGILYGIKVNVALKYQAQKRQANKGNAQTGNMKAERAN